MAKGLKEEQRKWGQPGVVGQRLEHALTVLMAAGVIGGPKDKALSVRVESALLAAARDITGIESDSDLLRAALANLVASDDFGPWLVAQAGGLPPDFELEL